MTVEQEDARARGSLADTPFIHLLLFVYRQGASGTLELHDGFGMEALVSIQQGRPAAVTTSYGGTDLMSALVMLCGQRSGEYAFYASDRIERPTFTGSVDPYALLYASLREHARDEAVEGVLARYPTSRLMLPPDRDVSRLGLDEADSALIARLRLRPATVGELLAWSQSGLDHARRLVYALLVTHMVAPQEDRVDALYRSQVIEVEHADAQPQRAVAQASGAPAPMRRSSPLPPPVPPSVPPRVPSTAPHIAASMPPRARTGSSPSVPVVAPPASMPPRVPSAPPASATRPVPQPPRPSTPPIPPGASMRPGAGRSMPPLTIGGVNEVASASMPAWQRLLATSQSMRPPAQAPITGSQPVIRAPARGSVANAINDPATRRKRAEQFYQGGRFAEALALLEDLCKEYPKDATLHGQRARALFEVHRTEPGGLPRSIVDAVRKAHELDADEPNAFFAKGLVYKQAGELAKSVACFKRVLRADPKNIDAQREIRLAKMRL